MSKRILTQLPAGRTALKDGWAPTADFNRRGVLRGALTVGALTLLPGCDVSEDDSVQDWLRAVSSWNDGVQAAILRPDHLAPTFSPSQVVKPPRFNAYYSIAHVKPVDGATWKLELGGLIADKRPWTLPQIDGLPEQELIIRHICVGAAITSDSGPARTCARSLRAFAPI